jgi:hypothetical protein
VSDVAELGLKVDSGDVKRATTDLAQFAGVSKKAQDAAKQLSDESKKVGVSMGVIESMARRAGASTEEMQKRIDKASASVKAIANVQGVGTGMTGTASRLLTNYNLISIALQGIAAASAVFVAASVNSQPTLEQNLDEHARLINSIRDAYKDAADKAGRFHDASKVVLQLQNAQNAIALQADLLDKSKRVSGLITSSNNGGFDPMGNFTGVAAESLPQFEAFKAAIDDWNRSIEAGNPQVERFRDAIAAIGNADPALGRVAADLLRASQEAGDQAIRIKDSLRAARLLAGTATPDDREGFGLSNRVRQAPRDPFDSQVISINKHIAAMRADALAVDATAGEHARLRTEAQLYEAAQQKGGVATAAQVERLKALGQVAAIAAQALARANINSQIGFGRSTAFLSSEDVQIAQQLRSLYPDVATALGSVEAQALRVNNTLRELSGLGQDINRGLFVEFGQQFRNGATAMDAFEKAGLNALGKIADKLMQMAADQLWSSAFGGGGSGGGLLGAISGIGRLFTAANGGTFGPGWGIVGERGPELINVHSRGVTVVPNHISKPYLPGFAEGGMLSHSGNVTRLPFGQNNAPISVSMPISVDASGSEPGDIAKAVRGYVNSPDFDAKVVSAVTSARKRNVKI